MDCKPIPYVTCGFLNITRIFAVGIGEKAKCIGWWFRLYSVVAWYAKVIHTI